MILTLNSLIGLGFSALVSLFVGSYLLRKYSKTKNETLGYFAKFISFRFVMFALFALASLVYLASGNLVIPAVLGVIAWAAVFVSVIFPALIFCKMMWPKVKNIYAGILAIAGLLAVGTLIIKFAPGVFSGYPGIAYVLLPDITLGSFSTEFFKIYMFCKIFGVLPLALLFLSHIFKGEGWTRARGLLIGLGLLWVVSTLFIPDMINKEFFGGIYSTWSGIYCCVGDILILMGILRKQPQK